MLMNCESKKLFSLKGCQIAQSGIFPRISRNLLMLVTSTGLTKNHLITYSTFISIITRFIFSTDCLPRPTLMPNYYLYKIYGTYFFIFLIILSEAYTHRLQRVICAYFYPKVSWNTSTRTKNKFTHIFSLLLNLAMPTAWATSHQLPNSSAWVQFQVRSCGVCGKQSGTEAGLIQVLQFLLPTIIPLTAPYPSSEAVTN
jgi:hypothetical protein